MTKIVGILNITPDSFSGDGVTAVVQAEAQILRMIDEGADVIDIGAESTRPGAVLLTPEQEWQRLGFLAKIIGNHIDRVGFSLDTRHYTTAKRFLESVTRVQAGSIFINDVSGGKDKELIALTRDYGAHLILTHSLTIPADPAVVIADDADAVEVVYAWAAGIMDALGDRVIIDPGIGFGKTAKQSLDIICSIARIKSLGAAVMVGHSRKSFLSLFADKKAGERDPETVLFSDYLVRQGVDYLRVHDVKSHAAMMRIRKIL